MVHCRRHFPLPVQATVISKRDNKVLLCIVLLRRELTLEVIVFNMDTCEREQYSRLDTSYTVHGDFYPWQKLLLCIVVFLKLEIKWPPPPPQKKKKKKRRKKRRRRRPKEEGGKKEDEEKGEGKGEGGANAASGLLDTLSATTYKSHGQGSCYKHPRQDHSADCP